MHISPPKRDLSSRKSLFFGRRLIWAFCFVLVFFISSGLSPRQGGQDFCCMRDALFIPIPMPPEQEYDASFMISAAWYGALRESDILDCPIEYGGQSWEGRAELDKIIEDIGEAVGVPPDPTAREAFKKLMDVEYIWKGTLTLNRVDEIEPGYWEEGYLGKKNYVPGQAYGDWTLHMKLINVHFGEVVKQGQTSWTGSAFGTGSGAVKNLARSVFSPVDDLIYDYEHIPWSCEVDPEEDEISVGDKMSITIKDIKDSKGREPKPWQRIVVKLEKGEITNGTKLGDEGFYAFLAGGGKVEVKYKAPEDCKDSGTEKVTVYNSCDWGQKWVRPMRVTNEQREIGDGEFEITCDWEGTIESTFKMDTKGDESLLSSVILAGGKFQGKSNWKLDVVFKLDRGNERAKIYELKSARFVFSEEGESEIKMQKEGREVIMGSKGKSQVRGRTLARSECDLELIIDLKKKAYKIEGILRVENIPGEGEGRLKIDVGPIQQDRKDTNEGKTEISEDIFIEGEFSEDAPKVLEGSLDEIKATPPEFQEFMKAMAGQISSKIRWKLERKGKH